MRNKIKLITVKKLEDIIIVPDFVRILGFPVLFLPTIAEDSVRCDDSAGINVEDVVSSEIFVVFTDSLGFSSFVDFIVEDPFKLFS